MIKLALVDDHVILRRSLSALIRMLGGFEILFEADNGEQCIEQVKNNLIPDIILLDITMPVMDGVQTASWLQASYPQIKILTLSMIKNDALVLQMIKKGASGYILKDCEPEELQKALQHIYDYGYYYNELVTPKMKYREDLLQVELNDREILFLRWACTDLTHKQIADEMQVSPRTIDGYRDALFRKLNVNSRVGIAVYAIKNGIVRL